MLRSLLLFAVLVLMGSFSTFQDTRTFPQLYFKENSIILTDPFPQYNGEFGFSDFKDSLEAFSFIIQKFKMNPKMKLKIQGYADLAERDPLKLTEQRVKKVRACLVAKGIDSTQLPMVWDRFTIQLNYEKDMQTKCDGDLTCLDNLHQENRRVFFTIASLK